MASITPAVAAKVATLPLLYRQVLNLRHVYRLGFRDIAAVLRLEQVAVRAAYYKALVELRNGLVGR